MDLSDFLGRRVAHAFGITIVHCSAAWHEALSAGADFAADNLAMQAKALRRPQAGAMCPTV
jgi:hypothetical protein